MFDKIKTLGELGEIAAEDLVVFVIEEVADRQPHVPELVHAVRRIEIRDVVGGHGADISAARPRERRNVSIRERCHDGPLRIRPADKYLMVHVNEWNFGNPGTWVYPRYVLDNGWVVSRPDGARWPPESW